MGENDPVVTPRAEAIRLHREGLDAKTISERVGAGITRVRRWIVEHHGAEHPGLPVDHLDPYRPLRAEAVRLYQEEKLGVAQIAARFAVADATVIRWLRSGGEQAPKPRPTEALRAEAVRLKLEDGLSTRQIAERTGVGVIAVDNWVRAHREANGLPVKPSPRIPSAQERLEAVRLRVDEGVGTAEIAERFEVSAKTVQNWVTVYRRTGQVLSGRPASYDPELRAEAIRLRLEENLSRKRVAERLGMSEATVERWLRSHRRVHGLHRPDELPEPSAHLRPEAVRLRLEEGLTVAEIAQRLGVGVSQVEEWAQAERWARGEPIRKAAPKRTVAVKNEAVRLRLEEGLGCEEIAERFDVSADAVLRWVHEHYDTMGLAFVRRDQGPHPQSLRDEAVRLRMEEGLHTVEVAKHLGVHENNIRIWVKAHCAATGVPAPNDRVKYSPDTRTEAVRLHLDEGIPIPDVAKRLGTSQRSVRHWLHVHLGTIKPRRSQAKNREPGEPA